MKAIAVMISAVLVLMCANAAIELIARATWTGPLIAGGIILATVTAIVWLTVDLLRDPR
jgi:hypothetical protein